MKRLASKPGTPVAERLAAWSVHDPGAAYRRGSAHGRAKLSEFEVLEMRARYADGVTQKQLAAEYGVAQVTVGGIIRRKLWHHV